MKKYLLSPAAGFVALFVITLTVGFLVDRRSKAVSVDKIQDGTIGEVEYDSGFYTAPGYYLLTDTAALVFDSNIGSEPYYSGVSFGGGAELWFDNGSYYLHHSQDSDTIKVRVKPGRRIYIDFDTTADAWLNDGSRVLVVDNGTTPKVPFLIHTPTKEKLFNK